MSDKFCCVTYQELAPELIQSKSNEIDSLVKEKGLPRSVFASVIKLLNTMTNYCPSCGECLSSELKQLKTITPSVKINTEVENERTVVPNKVGICRPCGGRGTMGVDSNNIKINCMSCHGSGKFESKHIAVDPNAKLAQSKVEDLRAASGINDGVVSGPTE